MTTKERVINTIVVVNINTIKMAFYLYK